MTFRNSVFQGMAATAAVAVLAAGLMACGAPSTETRGDIAGARVAQVTPVPTGAATAQAGTGTPSAAPSVEDIGQALSNIYANVNQFQADVVVTLNPGASNSATTNLHQWFKQPNMTKLEVRQDSANSALVGSMLVYDGKTLSVYDAATNQALQIQDQAQLVLFLNLPQAGNFAQVHLFQAQQFFASLAQNSTFSIDGADVVAGRPTTIVSVTQNNAPAGSSSAKLWIDDQTRVPLRAQLIKPDGSVLVDIDSTVFDPNAQVSDSDFAFTAPSGATIVTPSPADIEAFAGFQPTTLQDAQSSAGYTVLQPSSLPSGVSLQSVGTSTEDNSTVVALFYGTDPQDISTTLIEKPANLVRPAIRGAQTVNINGVAGQMYSSDTMTVIDWVQGGTALTLATTLPSDQALQIAQSVQ